MAAEHFKQQLDRLYKVQHGYAWKQQSTCLFCSFLQKSQKYVKDTLRDSSQPASQVACIDSIQWGFSALDGINGEKSVFVPLSTWLKAFMFQRSLTLVRSAPAAASELPDRSWMKLFRVVVHCRC